MAKQIGAVQVVGTIEDICFYKMKGRYYARKKSSLTGKRVKRDPKFARTMASACRLGRGSQLASKVYRSLPGEEQVYALFKELKSTAILALKQGKSEAEVLVLLRQRVVVDGIKTVKDAVAVKGLQPVPSLLRLYGRRVKGSKRTFHPYSVRKFFVGLASAAFIA